MRLREILFEVAHAQLRFASREILVKGSLVGLRAILREHGGGPSQRVFTPPCRPSAALARRGGAGASHRLEKVQRRRRASRPSTSTDNKGTGREG